MRAAPSPEAQCAAATPTLPDNINARADVPELVQVFSQF